MKNPSVTFYTTEHIRSDEFLHKFLTPGTAVDKILYIPEIYLVKKANLWSVMVSMWPFLPHFSPVKGAMDSLLTLNWAAAQKLSWANP
jgi:hypothetical protein